MKTLIFFALVSFAAAQIQVQIPIQRPQPPVQQWPQQPIQRPQQPIQPPIQPIQPPISWPQQPLPPRAAWREGVRDTRCPIPDDHEGYPVFLPGDGQWAFFKCWGGLRFPFNCPDGTVFRTEVNVCADPGWTPPARWPIRPFNEEQQEEETKE